MEKILIIDDDKDICLTLSRFLSKKGFETHSVNNGTDAVSLLKSEKFDGILCDYKLPDTTGLELIQRINILNPEAATIIITGYSDLKTAVEILKHGASDYVTKPLFPDEILASIKQAIEDKKTKNFIPDESNRNSSTKVKLTAPQNIEFGPSPQSKTIQKHIDIIAPTDMSVIITGETGTGKEFVAKAIHHKSNRKDKPFIAIDCGALPKDLAGSELFGHLKGSFTGAINDKKGSFEVANGGTIFLDEIGNLSYDNQIKLLRVLQERKIKRIGDNKEINIDVRVIVATNENLKKAAQEGTFREDIFHRLNEFSIEMSPLRERAEDITFFANVFLQNANRTLNKNIAGFKEDVKNKLENYQWYGNLRELQNVIKRAVLLSQEDLISLSCLPSEIIHPALNINEGITSNIDNNNLKKASINAERLAIIEVLKKVNYNKTKAAQTLNIDRKTLYNKLKAYEIEL